ncbi:MAG: hypothetical protein R2909_22905 [Gemmatimonadales bacterium]
MTTRQSYDSQRDGPSAVSAAVSIPKPRQDNDLEAKLELPSGRTIVCSDAPGGGELVTIRGAAGAVELEVRLTEKGPVLRFEAAGIELVTEGALQARCGSFEVHAAGDIVERAGGTHSTQAHTTTITSTRGDVAIKANDDVRLNGERVKLNC